VRWVLVLIAGLFFLGCWGVAHQVEQPSAPRAKNADPWRRTAKGWENQTEWKANPPAPAPALHPLTVAAFQALAVVCGLVAFTPVGAARSRSEATVSEADAPAIDYAL
jgi:negative regulator of sigma E activity